LSFQKAAVRAAHLNLMLLFASAAAWPAAAPTAADLARCAAMTAPDARRACNAGSERSGETGGRAYRSGTGYYFRGICVRCGPSAGRCTRPASGGGLVVKVHLPGRARG
jgi:hypothetical protein